MALTFFSDQFFFARVTDDSQPERDIAVEEVLLEPATQRLQDDLKSKMPTPELADAAFRWLRGKLPITLTFDADATHAAQDAAEQKVEDVLRKYTPEATADNVLARAGEPIDT